jgi:hypothetical protein
MEGGDAALGIIYLQFKFGEMRPVDNASNR